MIKQTAIKGAAIISILGMLLVSAHAGILGSKKEGMVEYVGAQKDIFKTGKASSVVSLEDFAGRRGLYAMGPVDGLDEDEVLATHLGDIGL